VTDLSNHTALITGSARGIGKAIALRYASLGANIALNYAHDEDAAAATASQIERYGVDVVAIKADICRPDEVERLFTETMRRFGKIDIVVASAGVEIIDQPLLDATEEQFDRLFAINTKGAFFTLQRAAQHVADNGRIISIGSSTTVLPAAGVGLYGASKMAARYVVGVLALELGQRGIAVNTIIPTSIDGAGVYTDMTDDDPFRQLMTTVRPLGGRMGRPEDVADAAEYFAGELAGWVSGQHLLVAGGAHP